MSPTSETKSDAVSSSKKVRGGLDPKNQRFGRVALDLGYISKKQLKEALVLQKKVQKEKDSVPKLGAILRKKGYITEAEQKQIFKAQGLRGGHTEIEGYSLQEKIGSGAMGTVFLAHQKSMDRNVAIKILAPKLAMKKKYKSRFVSEARTVARLNHPHIVQGIDVGECNGIYYFVMEFIDGPTIEQVIERGGAMVPKRALKYVTQITKALKHARKKKLVHRDIKPENIMVNSEGNAKLCDLGIAQVLTGEDQRQYGLGTPNYIAPEQAEKRDNVSIQADIYALGASFFHMLTGRVPFTGDSPEDIIQQHLNDNPPRPSNLEKSVPRSIDKVVLKMMEKDLSDRYKTPSELLEDLESVDPDEERGPKRRTRRRRFRR